jgi:hypothetical protein
MQVRLPVIDRNLVVFESNVGELPGDDRRRFPFCIV